MRYTLVIDRTGPEPVHVFFPDHPLADCPTATPVILRTLPAGGRRYLGRSIWHPTAYREFRSEIELLLAEYEPAGPYQVFETWADYSHQLAEQPAYT